MEGEPVFEIGVGNLDIEIVAFLPDINGRLEPGLETAPIDLLFDGIFNEEPRVRFLFIFHVVALDFHNYFHNCGKPSVLLNNFCGEGSDIIALRFFKFKENVFFFGIFFRTMLEVESDPKVELEFSLHTDAEGTGNVFDLQSLRPFEMKW